MSDRVELALGGRNDRIATARQLNWQPLGAALAVGLAYYAGTKGGFALTFEPYPITVLWPAHALLFAALLLTPWRWWWLLIAGAFPAHLFAELQAGIPIAMVLCRLVSNVTEALIGALFVRRFAGTRTGLASVHAVIVFCTAAVLAPFVSSLLHAGLVRLVEPVAVAYWQLWQTRSLTNMLGTLTFVPIIITWAAANSSQFAARARLPEASALVTGLVTVSVIAFASGFSWPGSLMYLPMPFLLWAALRFGPPLTSTCFTIVALLVIWGAGQGRGPFLEAATPDALPIQLFLISLAVPLLFLAAVIKERRVAERKLRASEERFSTAFRSSPNAMAISRRSDGRIIDVNQRWLAFLGYEPGQVAQGHVAPLAMHADEAERAKLAALTRDGADIQDLEITLRNCQDEARQALVSIESVELEGKACLITIVRDITDQRRAELEAREHRKQLTHLTRIASLTNFSGALAHELNQPLTAILSNAQAAQRFLARDPPNVTEIRSILAEIAEADKRAGLVIHRLRLLMKKGEEKFTQIDLNQLVSEVLDFAHSEFVKRNIDVTASYSPDLPCVNGDRVQLQQLVLNLVSNACEAMGGHYQSEKTLKVVTVHGADGTAQVVVSDAGPGIPPHNMDRIFEPFFTTKDSGLGLGLSICGTITRAHGGTLTAENSSTGGASFRLALPAAKSTHHQSTPVGEASLDR